MDRKVPEGGFPPVDKLENLVSVFQPLNLVQLVFLDVVVALQQHVRAQQHVAWHVQVYVHMDSALYNTNNIMVQKTTCT